MSVYDDSAQLARVALVSDDVEGLLLTDGSALAGDPRRVRHLLTRMRATFIAHGEQMRSLQRDVSTIVEGAKRRADPVTAALDALAGMSLDDQRLVFDRRAQALIDAVEVARAEADRARAAAASETNRARVALGMALQDPNLTPSSREGLQMALAQIPLMQRPAPVALVQPAGSFALQPAGAAAPAAGLDDLFGAPTRAV